jgi:hypothetical protein
MTLVKEAYIRRNVGLEFLLDDFQAASVLLHGFASTCCTEKTPPNLPLSRVLVENL